MGDRLGTPGAVSILPLFFLVSTTLLFTGLSSCPSTPQGMDFTFRGGTGEREPHSLYAVKVTPGKTSQGSIHTAWPGQLLASMSRSFTLQINLISNGHSTPLYLSVSMVSVSVRLIVCVYVCV